MRILIHILSIPIIPLLEMISLVSPGLANRLAHSSILSASLDRQLGIRLF